MKVLLVDDEEKFALMLGELNLNIKGNTGDALLFR